MTKIFSREGQYCAFHSYVPRLMRTRSETSFVFIEFSLEMLFGDESVGALEKLRFCQLGFFFLDR